jgi:cytochrome subunit of sulfide dehydrogenase
MILFSTARLPLSICDRRPLHRSLRRRPVGLKPALAAAVLCFLLPLAGAQTNPPIDHLLPICTSCHGANGVSENPEIPSLAGQHEDYLLLSIKGYQSAQGVSEVMRAMVGALNENEVRHLANHFAAQPYIRRKQAADPVKAEQGREVYLKLCQLCHRDEGRSSSYAEYPLLAGQSLDYLLLTMNRILSGSKSVDILKTEMLSLASPEKIDQAVHFFAAQEVDPSQVSTKVSVPHKRRRFTNSR